MEHKKQTNKKEKISLIEIFLEKKINMYCLVIRALLKVKYWEGMAHA